MQNTRKRLLFSSIALLLCFAMLLGSTFAWFTASVSSTGNIIQAGNLDVEMYWADTYLPADSDQWQNADGVPIFTYDNWEPGYTDVKYVKITNNGSLNLKWKLSIEAEGEVSKLSDVIDVYYVNPAEASITTLDGHTSAGILTDVLANNVNSTGALTPKQSTILAIAFHMDEEAGNEYKDLSLCDEGFSIKLIAAQDVGEEDAFGDDYDIGADWGENTVNFAASTAVNVSNMSYGALANEIVIGGEGINATIPANVKLADGATSLDLTVQAVETDANITVGEGLDARSLDVHIAGVAADNKVPMIVNLGSIFKPGLDETEVKIYHTENGVPVLMTRVATVNDFARHNQFTYNPANGEVCIYVASFSVFSVVQAEVSTWNGQDVADGFESGTGTEADPFIIKTADQLVYFRNQVDAGVSYEGQYVKLAADIDLRKHLFDPIGFGYTYGNDSTTAFMGIFDGGNHTIYNLYQNGWDLDPDKENYSTYTYSTAGAGLFASIENATIKNLVVSGANIVFECVDMGIIVGYAQGDCHFENIVVTNSTIANYNRYTGGIVGEVNYGSYGTDTTQGFSHTFKNIVVDSSVTVSSLWGSFDTSCGGVIGGKWGDATVKMENVISACTLDVFSDVTAAYQWYAYRRCGMLIGHTEQNSPKKALNAAAAFLVCENVDVYYGDWVNYHYYEFENQDSSTGQRYPWVRAEAGLNNGAFSNPRYGVPTHDGVKVTEDPNMETLKTDYTPIVFGQLYGGGQGVYGCNEHEGVTIHNTISNAKTVYIVNNQGLSGLKLRSWFKNGEDIWTTNIDGIDMSFMATTPAGIAYEVVLPAYADGFEILYNGEVIGTFEFANLTEGTVYNLDASVHTHVYTNGVCAVCGYACTHVGGSATCTTAGSCTVCGVDYIPATGHSLYWASDDELCCYQKCHNCSYTESKTSHQWTGGTCTQCKRTPNIITNISDEYVAYGFDTTVSFTFGNTSEAAGNYDVYVMQGVTGKLVATASDGTLTFNVSSLGAGTYSIAAVHKSSGQWVDARQFNIVDPGLTKYWSASTINSKGILNNGMGGDATKSLVDGYVRLYCNTPNSESQLRLTMLDGTSFKCGYMVIKYRKNTYLNGLQVYPINGSSIVGANEEFWISDNQTGVAYITKSFYYNGNIDQIIIDFFTKGISAGHYIDIEYIAFVTDPNYIG